MEKTVRPVISVAPETPKAPPTVTEMKKVEKKTPGLDRKYKLIGSPSIPSKGRQRAAIMTVMLSNKEKEWTIQEIAKIVERDHQYNATAGTIPSVAWHLHQMKIAVVPLVKVVNPTYEEEIVVPVVGTVN